MKLGESAADRRRTGRVFDIRFEKVEDLHAHAMIPSVFESATAFDVVRTGGRLNLVERGLPAPFRKDYDAIEDPLTWPREFDTSKWVLVSAFAGPDRIGGVIGAIDTPGTDMLEGRRDLAVVWDLRVAPGARRRAVATSLLVTLERWASEKGCTELKVETQNTNVPACRLYAATGLVLCEAHFGAYPRFPDEVQLIWRKRIFTP